MLASGGVVGQFFRNLNIDPPVLVHLPVTGPYSLWNMRNYLGMTKSGLPVKQTSPQHYIKCGYKPNFEKEL